MARYEGSADPKYRGTLYCFRLGSRDNVKWIAGPKALGYICGNPSSSSSGLVNTTTTATDGFQYAPFANGIGSYPHEYISTSEHFGQPDGEVRLVGGRDNIVKYDMQLQGPTHARVENCEWVFHKIVEDGACRSTPRLPWFKQSKGGWFQFEDDGTTFGMDPTDENSMDIDDILAEVNGDGSPPETRDLQELTRAWVTERSAPELLPWPSDLMDRVLGRIHQQIEVVEEQVGNVDPRTNFRLIIIQTELERFKFLVRSFLRTRMAKIDKYALYMLSNPTQAARLSASEFQYANSHQTLLEAHYRSSFLSQFPGSLQRLDDTAGGISMVEQPDTDTAVFVRALRDIEEPIVIEGTDTDFEMRRGDVYVVRWSAVRAHVVSGDAELI
ncbi:MAG: hypothetical protein Q9169_001871 [Polycauliona sp. 2 TL-2023]